MRSRWGHLGSFWQGERVNDSSVSICDVKYLTTRFARRVASYRLREERNKEGSSWPPEDVYLNSFNEESATSLTPTPPPASLTSKPIANIDPPPAAPQPGKNAIKNKKKKAAQKARQRAQKRAAAFLTNLESSLSDLSTSNPGLGRMTMRVDDVTKIVADLRSASVIVCAEVGNKAAFLDPSGTGIVVTLVERGESDLGPSEVVTYSNEGFEPGSSKTDEGLNVRTEPTPAFPLTWEPCVASHLASLLPSAPPLIVALVGPPGSGKSTSASALVFQLKSLGVTATSLPMDGYHLSLSDLPPSDVYWRGASRTFDSDSLASDFTLLRSNGGEGGLTFPGFDHAVGDPVPSAHSYSGESIVIVEGLYLLLPSWNLTFSYSIYIDEPIESCLARLKVRNKGIPGLEDVDARVEEVDRGNAVVVEGCKGSADCVVRRV